MAPNSRPPGNRMRWAMIEATVEAATRIASSSSCAGSNGPPTPRLAWPTRPSSDSPAGKPTAMIATRTVCTMAIARMSASSSAASPITCDRPPGAAARYAVILSQPCTTRRYAAPLTLMQTMATSSTAMLSG